MTSLIKNERCGPVRIRLEEVRGPMALGLVHHSDQGTQFTSFAFGRRLKDSGILASMGAVGTAYDNAAAESFFSTIKRELIHRRRFATRAEARSAIFEWIEVF